MPSSKVHFKLYKAKKNWVSAGLVTTAVLAGLTLGTAKSNDVVAHADATPVATQTVNQQTTTPASQTTETNSAVDKTSDQISQVKDELNKVQQANDANKNVQKTNDANKAADQDQQIVNNHKAAKQTVKDAQDAQATAKLDVDNAQNAVKQA
jgi:TolA-binding protein